MKFRVNVVIGATIAFAITFFTSLLTAISGSDVGVLADISQKQWIIMILGPLIAGLKDNQAIAVRRFANKITGTGDGGGSGPFEKRSKNPDEPHEE